MAIESPRALKTFMGSRRPSTATGGRGQYASTQALQAQFAKSMAEIVGGLNEFVAHVKDYTPDVLLEALEPTLGKSLEQVPVDTGDLAASAYLETESSYGRVAVFLGYAKNNNPDYAVHVHEMPIPHNPPTKNKFLQDPLDEDYYAILSAIPRLIREVAGT
jgi:hypothetical protein